jgi:hypothetical protein
MEGVVRKVGEKCCKTICEKVIINFYVRMKPLNYGRSTYIELFFFRGFCSSSPYYYLPYMEGFWP